MKKLILILTVIVFAACAPRNVGTDASGRTLKKFNVSVIAFRGQAREALKKAVDQKAKKACGGAYKIVDGGRVQFIYRPLMVHS